MTEESPEDNDSSPPQRGSWARRLRIAMMILGPLVLIAGGLWYYSSHRGLESTDDAYVQANIVQISPRISGRIVALPADDNAHVDKGDVLIKIDPASYQTAVAAARAKLAMTHDQVTALKAKYQALTASISSAQAHAQYLSREVQRNKPLAARNIVTQATLDKLNTELARAGKQKAVLEAQRKQALAKLGGNPQQPIKQNAAWLQAKAALQQALLNLADTIVRAPASGVLGHVGVRVGDTLAVGQPAFPLVESGHVWIKANFKETALTHMQAGQPVSIAVDAYPNHTWHGHVASISPASGQVFSLLPAQNASGNWVKVVQRIPVRIAIDDAQHGPVLRAGMSASVTVDVGKSADQAQ